MGDGHVNRLPEIISRTKSHWREQVPAMAESVTDIEAEIERLQEEITAKAETLHELRRELPHEPVESHPLVDWQGDTVELSDCFGDHEDLLVVHNMGRECVYCSLWADLFDGVLHHIEDRSAFVVVSPDEPATQRRFAADRGWGFEMLSDRTDAFTEDAGFSDGDRLVPGVSSYRRQDDGSVVRVSSAVFGPNDEFEPVWPLFELLADGPDGWTPQFEY